MVGGSARALPQTCLKYQWAKYLPDGAQLVALASEPQKGLRLYVQRIDSSAATPISPEIMVRNAAVSPDGSRVAVLAPDNRLIVYPVTGGEPLVVPTTEPLAPLRWSVKGDWIYVQHLRGLTDVSARISRLRLPDGKLAPWKELKPPDTMGVNSVTSVTIAPDEQSYIYSYRRALSELFPVDGW